MSAEQGEEISLEGLLEVYVDYLTFGIDIATGIIIGFSVIVALIRVFKMLRHPKAQRDTDREAIRFRLAGGLLLALDFAVGSDILKTIVVPTVNELSILAVIVAIRIILGWSLSKEITGHSEDILQK
ncbi:DUF1622 domain-containing protein [bacterium]|nr:DUF1622 domain-containing protein [bacterium]